MEEKEAKTYLKVLVLLRNYYKYYYCTFPERKGNKNFWLRLQYFFFNFPKFIFIINLNNIFLTLQTFYIYINFTLTISPGGRCIAWTYNKRNFIMSYLFGI